jgi:hypothetical protein
MKPSKGERAMKLLLLTGVCLVLISSTALACRGTTEYPQANQQLQSSTLPRDSLDALLEQLTQGAAMHEEAHQQGDMSKMGESIRILDDVKQKLNQ